ncbi:MAG: phosphatidylglycerol lysyltransferase domain-containing protein, partial [Thermodesulfobacteriota bacterium]
MVTKAINPSKQNIFLKFNQFVLKDQKIVQPFIDTFKPFSCEYNFSNLFTWQYASRLSWVLYQERLLIYDGVDHSSFMPLGKDFYPEELVELSQNLKNMGLSPDFCLATSRYLNKFPEIEKYYTIKKARDQAEYIYDVNRLSELKGKKLHKKRNLISQFKNNYPDYKVHFFKEDYKQEALGLARKIMERNAKPSKTLDQEFLAIQSALDHFDALGLRGIAIFISNKLVAFSVFSRLNSSTYDIHFEKVDMDFKGASQIINHETAKSLKSRCLYLNREQDLG